jgi:uncharacterized protein (DUF1800 family)
MEFNSLRRESAVSRCGWLSAVALAAALSASAAHASPPLRADDIAWLKRATFGIDSASIARYQDLGRTRYLDDDLASQDDTLPPAISAMIRGYEINSTPLPQLVMNYRDEQQKIKAMPDGDPKIAAKKAQQQHKRELAKQAMQTELLHAIYGGDQLKEQMVWFWLNHFSVYAAKGGVHLLAADYEENVIRPNALGKFKNLVMATLESPAMLQYLDNAKNVSGKTNENYARELMELHALGVGSGYSQQDVQQLALILTGAGVAGKNAGNQGFFGRTRPGFVRQGFFVFNPNKHDYSDKVFLGHKIRGSGFNEIDEAVELITRQPACAQFISKQLAQYFVADEPPPELVDAMAKTFQRTDGDIAAVLRTMFTSQALTASYGKKFKDPTQFLVSAMRLTYDGKPISNAAPLVNWMNQMGELPFGRITPDGWALESASWSGSGQMAKRFDVARAIGSGKNRLFMNDDDLSQPFGEPPQMDPTLFQTAIAPYLSASTQEALGKAASPMESNTFLLSSPEFNYR